MASGDVDWGPAVGVLVVGLVLAALLVQRIRRGAATGAAMSSPSPPLELRDLDGRIEGLLQQLRELEDAAAKRTPEQLARERYALELAAAHALQEREALRPSPSATAVGRAKKKERDRATVAVVPRPGVRGFLWGVVTAAALGFVVLLAARAAQPRARGGSLTGNTSSPGDSTIPAGDEAELRAAIARDPDDHDARLDLARHLLRNRDLMGVWKETQHVLGRVPGHPRALAYQALVRLAMGHADEAESMLKQSIAAAPDLMEAYLHLAYVYAMSGKTSEAESLIAEASRRFPRQATMLAGVLAQFREATASTESPSSDEEAPPADASHSVSGVIDATASARARLAPGTVLFVTVREAGVSEGPPVAVKRLVVSSLPLAFAVGPADSMMGQPLPERMRIEARADSDGDPITRLPSEPRAQVDRGEIRDHRAAAHAQLRALPLREEPCSEDPELERQAGDRFAAAQDRRPAQERAHVRGQQAHRLAHSLFLPLQKGLEHALPLG